MTQHTAGYSLLEVLAGLAIAAVLLGGSVISLNRFRARELRRTAEQLERTLAGYAAVAAASNREVSVAFAKERRTFEFRTGDGRVRQLKLPRSVDAKVRFGNLRDGGSILVFRGDGTVTAGSIELIDADRSICRVVQSLYGARSVTCTSR